VPKSNLGLPQTSVENGAALEGNLAKYRSVKQQVSVDQAIKDRIADECSRVSGIGFVDQVLPVPFYCHWWLQQ